MTMENILVCIKAVPADSRVSMDSEQTLQRQNMGLQWNIADEAALEAALQLKCPGGTVTVITMGPSKLAEPLHQLLGRGVDRAILLTDPCMSGADTYATAAALSAAVKTLGSFDLILCGRRAMDGETGQVPSMLAAALGMPCITSVQWLQDNNGSLTLCRRLEDRAVTLRAATPAVVSVCEYAYCLRLPSITAMRQAMKKQVVQRSATDLGLTPEDCGLKGSLTRVIHADHKFPGLRNGQKETDLSRAARRLLDICREVDVCPLP